MHLPPSKVCRDPPWCRAVPCCAVHSHCAMRCCVQRTSHKPDCYSPQLGDAVVYIREGHEQALAAAAAAQSTQPEQQQLWVTTI